MLLCDHSQFTEVGTACGVQLKVQTAICRPTYFNGLNGGKLQYCCSDKIDI